LAVLSNKSETFAHRQEPDALEKGPAIPVKRVAAAIFIAWILNLG
jgi:hypothetical protein